MISYGISGFLSKGEVEEEMGTARKFRIWGLEFESLGFRE